MTDLTGRKEVEISIGSDGKVIWVNTDEGCVLRISRIGNLILDDRREEVKETHE